MLAADAIRSPLLLVSNIDPVQPGMVGMLAAGGALDQVARAHGRRGASIDDPAMIGRVTVQADAARAVAALRGSTFGRIGGRPMGMYTAVAATETWISAVRHRRRGDRPVGTGRSAPGRCPTARARGAPRLAGEARRRGALRR